MIRKICLLFVITLSLRAANAADLKETDAAKPARNAVNSKSASRGQDLRPRSTTWDKDSAAAHMAAQSADFAKAERLGKKAVADARRFDENDPRLEQSLDELAHVYLRQKKYAEARPLFVRVLKIQEHEHGTDSPALIQSLSNVVQVTCAGGACYNTIPYLKRMLAIRQKANPKSTEIPISLLLIGEAYEKQQKYPEAMDYFKQSVIAQKQIAGPSPMVQTLARNVERVRHEMAVCKISAHTGQK